MRLASSDFLRRVAAMSSYYNPRGSPRPRRGYFAGPSPPPPPPPEAGSEVVSGDSHLSAVRAANDSLRRGGGVGVRAPSPPYKHVPQAQPQPPQYGYGYGYGQPQQPSPPYGFVPYSYGHPQPLPPGPQYGYGTPNQYGHGHPLPYGGVAPNAGFRPGAPRMPLRLAEYRRRWRFAQRRPPRQAERFKVLSYNILADYLAQEHHFLYENIPSFILDWRWRKDKLVFEFSLWSPDILCLQEVDKFTDLQQAMTIEGYNGIWKMRTGNAVDGCAIFWRTTRFQLRYEEDIEFNKLGLRDNVAQLCVLESVVPRNVQTESINLSTSPGHPQQPKQVVVCNIHVLYNPKRGDVKLGQVRTLLDRAYTISKMWNDAPVILCGDFNSTPRSPLYNYILEQKLNFSGLARNTISGQQTTSPQGLYTGPSMSRIRAPSHAGNNREGSATPLNDHKHQTKATYSIGNYFLVAKEPVSTDFVSESSISFGSKIPSSGSTTLVGQVLLRSVEGPANDACSIDVEAHPNTTEGEDDTVADNSGETYLGGMKNESGELYKTDLPSAPTAVNNEILQSDSSKTVASSHMLMSYESSGLKDPNEELIGGNKKGSNAKGDLPGDVISEAVTCAFEGNDIQSDTILDVSTRSLDEKENANQYIPGQNKCMHSESEPSNVNSYVKFADTLRQIGTMSLEEESTSGVNEPTHLTSAVGPMHESNSDISDACGNQCTPEVISNSDPYSCPDGFENGAHASEDGATANEVLCQDLNSDPSFFKEFSGNNDCLLEYEDRWPTTSDVSPSAQQAVTSNENYHYYDPFRWTSDEIKTVTGNEECTCVEHNLKVRSVYTDVEDFEGTKDGNKEPLVTSYNRKFMGTVDYIWASEGLQTVQVLDTFPKEILKQTIGFPTKKWGSDHIALVCELAFTK